MRPEGSGCGELSNDDYGDESWHVEHSGADNGVEGAAHALASTDMCNGFAMALALLICSEPEAETNMEHAEHFMELKSLGPWHFEVDTEVEETSGPGAFTLPLFANLFIIVAAASRAFSASAARRYASAAISASPCRRSLSWI